MLVPIGPVRYILPPRMKQLRTIILTACLLAAGALCTGCGDYWKPVTPNLEPHIDAVFRSGQVTRCYIEERQNVLRCEITQQKEDGTREYFVASVHAKARKDFFAYLDELKVAYTFEHRE